MASKQKFKAPSGMHDILPYIQPYWRKVLNVCAETSEFYGFRRIDLPLLENSEIFIKGTGSDSDIVQKQMYTLRTKGGDHLTLRPEGTPGVVRAYIEHGMANQLSPVKLYYEGPMFRYERPQAGRFRQFHQFGVEVIGGGSPILDAEIIQLFTVILDGLQINDYTIHINSIGTPQSRIKYKKILKEYYRSHQRQICAACRERLKTNPLRVLDCKDEKCQRVKMHAPPILDYLDDESSRDFRAVLEFLDAQNLPYFVNPYLVRGLDYYTKTVFEVFTGGAEEGEKDVALGGGGRYDELVRLLGGGGEEEVPAVGFALGIERVVQRMKDGGKGPSPKAPPRVFLVQIGMLARKKSLALIEEFRKAGVPLHTSLGRDSIKSQLGVADRLNSEYTLILGHQEALNNDIIIREMENGGQETVPLEKIVALMKKRLARKPKKK